MYRKQPMKVMAAIAFALVLSLVLAACGNGISDSTAPPSTPSSEPLLSSSASTPDSIPNAEVGAVSGEVEITFAFTDTESYASNQYAVWVEDEAGAVIKTIFISAFAGSGSPQNPLPYMGEKLDPESQPIDAVTGATPQFGEQRYVWDLTDDGGSGVPAGNYNVIIEGGMYVDNSVVYTVPITIGGDEMEATGNPEYTSDDEQFRFMLADVTARYLP